MFEIKKYGFVREDDYNIVLNSLSKLPSKKKSLKKKICFFKNKKTNSIIKIVEIEENNILLMKSSNLEKNNSHVSKIDHVSLIKGDVSKLMTLFEHEKKREYIQEGVEWTFKTKENVLFIVFIYKTFCIMSDKEFSFSKTKWLVEVKITCEEKDVSNQIIYFEQIISFFQNIFCLFSWNS